MSARDDRSSALLVALPFGRIFPDADGALDSFDRQQLALLYRPLPVGAAIPETAAQVVNSSIENWYVIDYSQERTRPLSPIEWRFLKEVFAIWRRSERKHQRDERLRRALERRFSRDLTPKRRTVRDLYARSSTRDAGNVRATIRGESDWRASARRVDQAIRSIADPHRRDRRHPPK
jgi:hypothetical protein